MSFFGLTRVKSAQRNASEVILKEFARNIPNGWKLPISCREDWISLLRVTCNIPDNLPNLAPHAIDLIRRGMDDGTADTYISLSKELIAMKGLVEKVGAEKLSGLYAKKVKLVEDLAEDLRKSEEYLSEEIYRSRGGSQNHSSAEWLEQFKSRLKTQTRDGYREFLKTAQYHFELVMQGLVVERKLEGLWREELPSFSKEYECLETGKIPKELSESLFSTFTDACNKASFYIFKACQDNQAKASQD